VRIRAIVLGLLYAVLQIAAIARLAGAVFFRLVPYAPWLEGMAPLLVTALSILGLLALVGRPGVALAPVLYWVAAVSITSRPFIPEILMVLASYTLALYTLGRLGRAPSATWMARGTLLPLAGAAVGALAVYGAYRAYLALPSIVLPRSAGDLPAMYRVVGATVAFRLLALVVTLYLAYRAVEHLLGLLLAWLFKPPSLGRIEALGEREDLRGLRILAGRQYPVLEWAQSFFLSTLLAPLFLPVTRVLIVSLLPSLGQYAVAAYIVLGYVLSWLFNKVIQAGLLSHPSIDDLLRIKRIGPVLLLALSASGMIIIAYAALGGNPAVLLMEAARGRPLAPDPVAQAIDVGGLERSVLTFAKLLKSLVEAAVRLLWGG